MSTIRAFISYSHENSVWLTEWLDPVRQVPNPKYLLKQWQRAFRKENVEFWFDREEDEGLRGGERWRERIFEEIDRADLCILLVTQDFVLSPFIMDEELPRILARHREGQTEVLPVLLQPTRLKDLPVGSVLQWTPGGPTPLSEYHDLSTTEFDKARNQILDSMETTIQRIRRGPVPRPVVGVQMGPPSQAQSLAKGDDAPPPAKPTTSRAGTDRFEVNEVDGVFLVRSTTDSPGVRPARRTPVSTTPSEVPTIPSQSPTRPRIGNIRIAQDGVKAHSPSLGPSCESGPRLGTPRVVPDLVLLSGDVADTPAERAMPRSPTIVQVRVTKRE